MHDFNDSDEDEDSFGLEFLNDPSLTVVSNSQQQQIQKRKPTYEPMLSPPDDICAILDSWAQNPTPPTKVAVAPCDKQSWRAMLSHDWGEGHVESPDRLTTVLHALHPGLHNAHPIPGRLCTNADISEIHSPSFLDSFLLMENGAELPSDTPLYNLTYANPSFTWSSVGPVLATAIRTAVGTTLELVDAVLDPKSPIEYGLALTRPAGHHTGTTKTGTFCGANIAAIAAAYAITTAKQRHDKDIKVAIVDWDVHRSGGTEEIVAAKWPDFDEGLGSGVTRNGRLKIPGETTSKVFLIDIYASLGSVAPSIAHTTATSHNITSISLPSTPITSINTYLTHIIPALSRFAPDITIVSAGFDAAEGESEGVGVLPGMFGEMVSELRKWCGRGVVLVLEGGYDVGVLGECVRECFEAFV